MKNNNTCTGPGENTLSGHAYMNKQVLSNSMEKMCGKSLDYTGIFSFFEDSTIGA